MYMHVHVQKFNIDKFLSVTFSFRKLLIRGLKMFQKYPIYRPVAEIEES